jgi:hypothetical protein
MSLGLGVGVRRFPYRGKPTPTRLHPTTQISRVGNRRETYTHLQTRYTPTDKCQDYLHHHWMPIEPLRLALRISRYCGAPAGHGI